MMRVDRDVVRKAATLSMVVAAVVLAGCKRTDVGPAVGSSGTAIIPGTLSWDAETNAIDANEPADFRWEQATPTERYLVPINGTKAAIVKHRTYEQVDGLFLKRWHMPQERISACDTDSVLAPGAVVAFRTAQGTLGKLQVVGYRPLHDVSFPGAEALPEGWADRVAGRPDIEQYHLEIEWTLFRPEQP